MRRRVSLLRRLVAVLLLTGMSVLALSTFAGTFAVKEVAKGESPARRLIAERVKHLELLAKERSKSFDEELDLNYVSRRRIPTGPDPIHNRYSHNILPLNTYHAPPTDAERTLNDCLNPISAFMARVCGLFDPDPQWNLIIFQKVQRI